MLKYRKIYALLLTIPLLFSLTACVTGHVKNESEITQWVKEEYNVDSKVVSAETIPSTEEGIEDGKRYLLESKDGVQFTATSDMSAFGMDGSTFGYSEGTFSDYYKKLIEARQDEIHAIEEKYDITFLYTIYNGQIQEFYPNNPDVIGNLEEMKKIAPAIQELKDIIKPTDAYGSDIFMVQTDDPDTFTEWYYDFAEKRLTEPDHNKNDLGPYNSNDEFFDYQQTSPDIVDYMHRYINTHYEEVEYLPGHEQFIRPKVLFCIGFNSSEGYTKVFVDITHFNELYEQYNGEIPQEEFDKIILDNDIMNMTDVYDYVPYKEVEEY